MDKVLRGIVMSERFQDRYYDEENEIEPIPSPREILSNVAEEKLKNRAERKAIKEYKEIIKQLNSYIGMRRYIASRTTLDIKAINNLEKNILTLNKTLSALENTEILTEIYKRVANIPKVYNSFSAEEYLQKELEKRQLKNFLIPIVWPFVVLALIIVLVAINIKLLEFLFWAILIVPLGFLILFFLLQWIIGKEKMNCYPKFSIFSILTILVVLCIVLTSLNIL